MADDDYWTEIPEWLHVKLCGSIPSTEDVEDVEQDILMHIFRSRHSFKHRCSFPSWALSIARNRLMDFYRHEIKREKKEAEYAVYDRERRRQEEKMHLQAHLCALEIMWGIPERYREVVSLRFKGNTFEEIGTKLHISYEAARSRYRRAIAYIQRSLDSY